MNVLKVYMIFDCNRNIGRSVVSTYEHPSMNVKI